MCESICPVDAIRYDDEVAGDELPFIELNEAAFRDSEGNIVEPGGWSKSDAPIKDPHALAELAERIIQEKEQA
jgi:ferredoxin